MSGSLPGHAYWQRLLDRVADPETTVLLSFIVEGGVEKLYRGRVLRTDDAAGPVIDVRGEPMRLCAWERLRSVECLAPAQAVIDRQDAAWRAAGIPPTPDQPVDNLDGGPF